MGCKKNLPFKNFFYIITPYLIIYTPLETPVSSPVGCFFILSITLYAKPLNFILICPLSSRQVKYLKLSGKNTYISLWSVGIFYAHHFFLYFSIRLFSGIGYSTGMSDFSAS